MSLVNPRWERWIEASVTDFFRSRAAALPTYPETVPPTLGLPMHVEGKKRMLDDEPFRFELRMDGANFRELTKDCWTTRIEINILIHSAMGDTNWRFPRVLLGYAQAMFEDCIPIFKHPIDGISDPDSDGTFWINLALDMRGKKDTVFTAYFGQIDPAIEAIQGTVEGHYYQDFQEET